MDDAGPVTASPARRSGRATTEAVGVERDSAWTISETSASAPNKAVAGRATRRLVARRASIRAFGRKVRRGRVVARVVSARARDVPFRGRARVVVPQERARPSRDLRVVERLAVHARPDEAATATPTMSGVSAPTRPVPSTTITTSEMDERNMPASADAAPTAAGAPGDTPPRRRLRRQDARARARRPRATRGTRPTSRWA